LKRDTAPAPLAVISGMTPSTIAAVFIRMGRSRTPGDPLDRLALGYPAALQLLR
jgi:hypothetical protein